MQVKLLKMEASCNFCGSLVPSCLTRQKRSNLSSFIGSVALSSIKNRTFLDSISLTSSIRATASSSGGTKAVTTRRRKPKNVGTTGGSGKNVKNSEIPAVTTKGSSGKAIEKVQVKRKNQQQECIQEGGPVDVRALHQNGDPLGRKDLGKCVVRWLSQGMRAMALDFATAEMQGEFAELKQRMEPGLTFVIQAQPYLNAVPMPLGLEAICLKACTHYPTLFDNFQRELRDVLQDLQRKSSVQDWRDTESWKLLKDLASSGDTPGNCSTGFQFT